MSATVNGSGGGAVVNGSAGGLPSDPLSITHGGTGASTASAARTALGVATPSTGLDSARPAASLGALYTATDTLARYVGEDSGGVARWIVWGARGNEGRDTSAVVASTACVGATSATTLSSAAISGALVFTLPSSPSGASVLVSVLSATGWQIQVGANAGDRYELSAYRSGFGTTTAALGTVSSSPTTVHCLAWTLSGTNTRWSLDGSAAAAASHTSGSATTSTTAVRIAGNAGGFGAAVDAVSLVLWSTSVGDSDLAVVSAAARAAGSTPGRVPTVAGATELLRWSAQHGTRLGSTTDPVQGSLGGSLVWSAQPTLVVL